MLLGQQKEALKTSNSNTQVDEQKTQLTPREADSLKIVDLKAEGVSHWGKKDYAKALISWSKELELKKTFFGENHVEVSRTLHNLGSANYQLGLIKKSILFNEQALAIRKAALKVEKEEETYRLTQGTYKQLVKLNLDIGDYDKAILYYKDCLNTLDIQPGDLPEISVYTAQALEQKGGSYLDEAITQYKDAISIYDKKKDWSHKGKTLFDLGNAYEKKGDYEHAEKAYLESYDILYNVVQELNLGILSLTNNIGSFYVERGKLDEAKPYLEEALWMAEELFKGKQIYEELLAYPTENLGEYHTQKGDFKKGMEFHDKAIGYIIDGFDGIKDNLSEQDMKDIHIKGIKSDALDIFSSRSECLYKMGEKEKALENYQFIDKIIFSLRQDIQTESSNLLWVNKTRSIYKDAIQLALELNQKTLAFEFMEKSKSVLLFENLVKAQQLKLDEFDLTIREERDSILEHIQICQSQMAIRPKQKDSLNNILQSLKIELAEFDQLHLPKNIIEKRFKKNILVDFQKYLEQHSSIAVQFFGNSDELIACVISQDDIRFHTYKKDLQRTQRISNWIQDISIPKSNITKSDIRRSHSISHDIFKDIILPLDLPKKTSLVFIPDGILQFVPFEALLTSVSEESDFSGAPYLIRDNPIHYAYSASVQLALVEKSIPTKHSSAFIMSPQKFDGLAALGADEAMKVQALLNGELLEKDNASANAFLNHALAASIIHLSTHASGGNRDIAPWIAFSDRKLDVSELYNLQASTQLVTLSACETAKGELIAGEGVMSLARGFSFAGVPQVITSLWEVNEQSTTSIMESFYTLINKGMTPSEALHQAKLDYISNHSLAEASPYHWASFTAWGHDSINEQGKTSSWFWMMVGIIGVLGLFMFFGKKGR